ncbi:MAG: Lrp/AsnC family transcriptional regulator [Brevundimonas sp.]
MRQNINGRNALADELDPVDARILDILQQDAGLSVADVAERVGLSASPCWRRIKRLEDSGLIRKRVTLLNAAMLGLDFEVYAIVKLNLPSRDNLDVFESAVAGWPEVVQCATITGREDYVLRIITSDMHAFDSFLRNKLLTLGIVSDCESHIVTRGVKNVTALPLGIVTPHVT